jgi:hypothetical protein
MTLKQAAKQFTVAGLDASALEGQDEAFQTCLSFLDGIEKIRSQNRRHGSYGLKHIVENPSGRFGIPSSQNHYTGYVYEGTFILAALASGFAMEQRGRSLKATIDISERGLRRRALEITNHVA